MHQEDHHRTGYLLVHDWSVQRAATVLISVAAAAVVAEAVKLIVGRPRPAAADQASAYEASLSYPSGHVTAVAALLTATALVFAGSTRASRIGAIVGALAATLLVAWTRLYLGMHWLTDVGAGLVIGMATAALAAALVPPATALFAERAGHRIPGPRAGWLTPPRTRESHQEIGVPR